VNWELISQGLSLSVMGIMTTFMALGLFIATILLLRYVFPAEPRKKKTAAAVVPDEAPLFEESGAAVSSDEEDGAIAAAISAAIYVKTMLSATAEGAAYVPQRTGLGARLEQPRGRWWQALEYEQD
jgi:Na+-transporting methylmalonyl-CoA/oxaloacetate decarboxylase gamma subunit